MKIFVLALIGATLQACVSTSSPSPPQIREVHGPAASIGHVEAAVRACGYTKYDIEPLTDGSTNSIIRIRSSSEKRAAHACALRWIDEHTEQLNLDLSDGGEIIVH
jgi:hypothetical protein